MKPKDYLKEFIVWSPSGDPEVPFKTRHNGVALSVRLNDFPAEHLYTLIAGDSKVDFDDWRKMWTKSRTRKPATKRTPSVRTKASGYTKPAARTVKSKSLR